MQKPGCCRRIDMMSDCAGLRTLRDGILTRLGAEDGGENWCGTIAAIGGNRRSQRLVAFLWTVVANAPCVAQAGHVGSNSKCQHDGENREPQHGDYCLGVEQDQRQ